MTIRAGDLQYYYPNALGSADGQSLTAFNVQGGSTARTINSNTTEVDDYWNDAIFEGLTGTNVEDQLNHVRDYAQASGAIELANELPGVPVMPATFYLIHMGKGSAYRSDHPIPGLSPTDTVSLSASCAINYASFTNGEGDGELDYTNTGDLLQWKAPGDSLGAGVTITGDGEVTLYSADESMYARVQVDFSELPGSDQQDTITLTQPVGEVIPSTEAVQSETGITRYVAVFFKNINSVDSMNELHAWVEPRVSASTTAAGGIGTTEGTLAVTDASSMPARSFWILNETLDDCRYVKYRSGNTLYCSAAGAGLRGKTGQTWVTTNVVSVWADVDLTKPTLVADALPSDLSILTYTTPLTYDDGLDYGTFLADGLAAIVMRETVLDTVYPIDSILTQLKLKWW